MSDRSNRTDPWGIPEVPETADLHHSSDRNLALKLRTHQTATVTKVSADGRTVDVLVGSLAKVKDHDATPTRRNPNPVKINKPVELSGIPVAIWETAAGRFTVPIVAGDTGELHIQDRDLSAWMRVGIPVEPGSAFTHMLGDAVFHPTVRKTGVGPDVDKTATVVDGALLVKIGAEASEFVPLVESLESYLSALFTAGAAAAVPQDGGKSALTLMASLVTGSIAPPFPALSADADLGGASARKAKAE